MEVNLVTKKYLYKTEVRTYKKGICKTDPIAKKEPSPLPRLPEYEDISFFQTPEFLEEAFPSYVTSQGQKILTAPDEFADPEYGGYIYPKFIDNKGWTYDPYDLDHYEYLWKFGIEFRCFQYVGAVDGCDEPEFGSMHFRFVPTDKPAPNYIPGWIDVTWVDELQSSSENSSRTGECIFDILEPELIVPVSIILFRLEFGESWENEFNKRTVYFSNRGREFVEYVANIFRAEAAILRCRSNGKSAKHRLGLLEDKIIEQHKGMDTKLPATVKHDLAKDMNPANRRNRCPYCEYALDLNTNKYRWQWDLSPTDDQRAQGLESNPDAVAAYSNARARSKENSRRRSLRVVSDLAYSNEWEYFVTLTLSPETTDRYDYNKCVNIVSNWLKFMRKQNPDLRYIVVPEQHHDGAWHFHALMSGCSGMEFTDSGRKDLSGRTIYNVAKYKYGFTTATEIAQDPEEQEKAVRYLLKYLTKSLDDALQHRKRYWSSRNLKKPIKMEYYAKDLDDAIEILSENAATHKHIEMKKDKDGYGVDMVLDIFVFREEFHYCDTYTMLTSLGIDLSLARSIPLGMTEEEARAVLEAA